MIKQNILISIPALKGNIIILLLSIFSAGIIVFTFREVTNHGYVFGLIPMFDVDKEANIPTYVQGVFMLMASILLFTIAKFKAISQASFIKH